MRSSAIVRSASLSLFALLFLMADPASANSHARIVRLSLVDGDVRLARDVKGDPLGSQNATWEAAELNLPIRQGYVLATDKGRAEVEFENGAMAFLGEDTVLEFFDLSLEDGVKTTRLVLRQGTASFYVTPSNGDYFSVTGGDFTVEASERTTFRLDNYDDGSVVEVAKGRVNVLRKNKPTTVAKGESLAIRAGDDNRASLGKLPASDDFDRWVSGRIDATVAANVAAQPYVGSYSGYGVADLYTYGGWYNVSGCGMCWRPYGVGYGWSPFADGGWFLDSTYGMTFVGSAPWGWLPYHFGGWYFDPFFGWVWDPVGFYGYNYLPVTGVFLHPKRGPIGIVPVHPLDVRGKTPINLARGVFLISGGKVAAASTPVSAGEHWKVVKTVPRDALTAMSLRATAAPVRASRTLTAGNFGAGSHSAIAYDPVAHRFVAATQAKTAGTALADQRVARGVSTARTSTAFAPRNMTPPPARTAYTAGGSARGGSGFERSSHAASSVASGSAHVSAPSGGGGRAH
jgi:FecR protein